MNNLIELSKLEQSRINGGNQESYDFGYRLGKAIRDAAEAVAILMAFTK